MPKIQRLDANGNLFVQGSFDEISGTRIREFANGDLFAKEFDEIATELDSSNTIRRIMADGSILIKGFFDEVTKLEAAGGGGGGDTNLQFNITGGTNVAGGPQPIAHVFNFDGTIILDSNGSGGTGTWYNGTPTGSNFEMQIEVTVNPFLYIVFESSTFSGTTGTSSWFPINTARYIEVSGGNGSATVIVRVREVAVPGNQISQTFTYDFEI